MMVSEFAARLIGSLLTLYMMALLLRWTAPWLEFSLEGPWLRPIPRLTDPLINLMRRLLPQMGPLDWAPIAALMGVWLLRLILVGY